MNGRLDDMIKLADQHSASLPMDALSVLCMCHEYMEQRSDISDETDDDGSPRPNEEMVLLTELQTILEKYDR